MKTLKDQIAALQQKIELMEQYNGVPRKVPHVPPKDDDAFVTLPKDRMMELLNVMTHCLQKEQQKDDAPAPSLYDKKKNASTDSESSSKPPISWRRFTTLV